METSKPQLILASKSPFRRQLLATTGYRFQYQAAPIEESKILADTPKTVAESRAKAKALAVATQNPSCIVVGSDQTMEFEGKTYGKVSSIDEARDILWRLQGKTHQLHSAICVARNDNILQNTITSNMTMRPLDANAINRYLDTGEWQGTAGCYQWENKGCHLFEKSSGDTSAIIGLPILPLLQLLREAGLDYLA